MREKIKNSFQEGLIMDFSPDHTQATYLTNALNATLITNNGNEMSLQNDMGNGRVETAFLPEGYIPVGTCEYGDIIYIVSYNPLENKSLIGCFPSPERNIASDELGDLNQTLTRNDFLEIKNNKPTGTLKASSVKKILMGEKYLHPGDKFIIAALNLNANGSYLSDYDGNNTHNYLPKYLKIHVVSIEDSGKIVYLDSDIKWNYKFYINDYSTATNESPDIDDYRETVTSNYSVFTSKVSGKLALLIELEKITAFDCSWFAVPAQETNPNSESEKKNYDIYLEFNWDADNYNISPNKYIVENSNSNLKYTIKESVSSSKEDEEDEEGNLTKIENTYRTFTNHYNYTIGTLYDEDKYTNNIKLNDDYSWSDNIPDSIVNYHYKKPVYKKLFTVEDIPLKKEYYVDSDNSTTLVINDLSNTYYECDIVPCMHYGKLDELKLHIRIDFDKIGTKNINLHTWKYYNYDNVTTLTWGLDAYTQPNHTIKEVTFEFYDNEGFVCAYHNIGKKSYNGVFTENIILNLLNSNYKINNIQYPQNNSSSTKETEETDSRTIIQSNFLYLVKIIVLYRKLNLDGTISDITTDDEIFYRWIWTNGMWNEFYYQCLDFDDLNFNLELDLGVYYSQINPDKSLSQTVLYEGDNTQYENEGNDEYINLKANVIYNLDDSANIQSKIDPGLINTYDTFSLHGNILEQEINVGVQVIDENYIDTNQSEVEYIDELNNINYEILKPNIGTYNDLKYGKVLNELLNLNNSDSKNNEINSTDYKNYKDWFTFVLNTATEESNEESNKKYISYNGDEKDYIPDFTTQDLDGVYLYNTDSSKPFEFTFNTILFNKYYELRKIKEIECFIIKPVIYSKTDLEKYNLKYSDNNKYDFNSYCSMAMWYDDDYKIRYFYYDSSGEPHAFLDGKADDYLLNSKNPLKIHEVLQVTGGSLYDFCKGFTPFILVKEDDETDLYQIGKRIFNNSNTQKTNFKKINKTGILTLPNVNNQLNILNFYYNPNNNNIAKMLISLLSQLYYCNGEIGKYLYNSLQNIVYYKPFEYTLTKDILYHIDTISNASDLICIKGILYSTYVSATKGNAGAGDKVSENNTKLTLHEVTKNYPIQFKFKYVQPSYYDEGTPKYLVKCSDGNNFTYNSGVINNKLYCIKDRELKTPTSKDSYYMCKTITEDINTERLKFEYDDESNNFGNIYPNFTMYNDEFRCTATTINSGIEIVEIDDPNSNKVRAKLQYIKTDEILDHDLKFNN